MNCLLKVALQPWDSWTPSRKRGHNFFQSLSTGRGGILLNGQNALSVTKIPCWRSPMSSFGLLSALSVLYVFLRFCFFLLCSFLLDLFFSVFVSPLYLVLPSVLFSHFLWIHLFSDLPCCFVFKSAILSFLFSYDSLFLWLYSVCFSLIFCFYSILYSMRHCSLSFTPVYTPFLVRIRWYSLFFLLFFLPAFSLFLYFLSVLSGFFVSFLLLFSLFFFFGSLPVLSFVCYSCSHCLFFVRHSYRVVTTWRWVFLTSRTFFKAKNNIRYILNVD